MKKVVRILVLMFPFLPVVDIVSMEKPFPQKSGVLAINLDLISKNKASNEIVANVYSSLALFKAVGVINSAKLCTKNRMEQIHIWAKSFEKGTTGKGNIVLKLAQKIYDEFNIKLTPDAMRKMIDVGVEPQLKIPCLSTIKQFKACPLIAIANQDYFEYSFYKQKMKNKNVNLNNLFSAVVTLPIFEDNEFPFNEKGYYRYKEKPLWYLANEPYPSTAFKNALSKAACSLGYAATDQLTILNTEEELKDFSALQVDYLA